MKIEIQTATLMLVFQYWMTSAAAVNWFGTTMMYLNLTMVRHDESVQIETHPYQ